MKYTKVYDIPDDGDCIKCSALSMSEFVSDDFICLAFNTHLNTSNHDIINCHDCSMVLALEKRKTRCKSCDDFDFQCKEGYTDAICNNDNYHDIKKDERGYYSIDCDDYNQVEY